MIALPTATLKDFETIQQIAFATWPKTYKGILTDVQQAYMLDMMYSKKALAAAITLKKQQFLLINYQNSTQGFVALETNSFKQTLIHKLYLKPTAQGKGIGKLVMQMLCEMAKENQSTEVILNVNRHNSAVLFYQKMGFEIVKQEDIAIGNGYFMEDYKMRKLLV